LSVNNVNLNQNLSISADYSGAPGLGAFVSVLPSTFVDSFTANGGTTDFWSGVYISTPTLDSTNNITTNKTASVYIQSAPVLTANQTTVSPANLALGYTGSPFQIAFEDITNNWSSGMYTNSAGSLNLVTPDTFAIQSNTFRFNNSVRMNDLTTTFYSTKPSINSSTGSVVITGGLGVNNINLNTMSVRYQYISGITNNGNTSISNLYTVSVLNPATNLTNYTLAMPVGYDGQILTISSVKEITNVTMSNTSLSHTTFAANSSIRMLYIESINLWVNA